MVLLPISPAVPCAVRRQNPFCWPWLLRRTGIRQVAARDEFEKLILNSQPESVQAECRGYLSLLKYWGSLMPRGTASGTTEVEAYTSLMLFLRLANSLTTAGMNW